MFTGIVTDIGEISDSQRLAGDLRRFVIASSYNHNTIGIGASIACSGVCLTVIETGFENGRSWFAVDAAAETIALTTVRSWEQGTKINLERSLKMGDELGGHLVSGHVDGIAVVLEREDLTDQARFRLTVPPDLSRFIAKKGSVALDGVSLTVNDVDGNEFSVLVIPHTLQVTTVGEWRKDTQINLEIDVMARYAARLMEAR